MPVVRTTVSKLFGASWFSLTWEEKRLAAAAVFPETSADADHFIDPTPYTTLVLGSILAESAGGTSGSDYILAGGGADTVSSGGGNDFINAGSGQDSITAGAGNDVIVYDRDDLRVHGGSGIDTLLVRDRGTTFAGSVLVYSIEVIDLENGFRDNIQFSAQVLSASRDRELRITGDTGDILDFASTLATSFLGSVTENGVVFDRYKIGSVSFGVEQGIVFRQGLAPELVAPSSVTVSENNVFAFDLQALDDRSQEGAGLSYAIAGGADGALFTVDPVTGVVSFLAAPDFEMPADQGGDNVYDLVVKVTDGNGLIDTRSVAVTVTDLLDTAGPTLAAPASATVAEGSLAVLDLDTTHLTDAEGAGLIYSITGGPDELIFAVDPTTGELSFLIAPDFEQPGDFGGDNVYDVTVTVTDSGGLTSTRDIAVTVTDVFENQAPVFTGPALVTAAENQTLAVDLGASDDRDSDGGGLVYAITGGADAALFTIDGATGEVRFVAAPDFEAPGDLDADNLYDLQVEVTDSGGLSARQDLQVAVSDRPNMQFIFSSGQSLSVGVTGTPAVLSNAPLYPANALALDFGVNSYVNRGWQTASVNAALFQGFRALQEYGTETHVSSMINRLVSEYGAAGLDSPVFTHVNTGSGGRSILQLMTGSQDIYADLGTALSSTAAEDVFAINNFNGTYSYYLNTGDGAQLYGTRSGRPVFFDNLVTQLTLGVQEAARQGYDISKDIVLNWIQGQDDVHIGGIANGYEFLLGKYFEKLEAVVEGIIGDTSDVIGMVSQHRGYSSKGVAIDQITFVNAHPGVIFGAPEFQFEARYPSAVGSDYTHLSPEGYYMMGQQLGSNLFDALTGHENAPILISSVTQLAPDMLQVDFSGVEGALVDDPSIYAAGNGLHAPPDMGFRLYTSTGAKGQNLPDIIDVRIIDADSVVLQFNTAVAGQYRLYLGRTEENLLDPALGNLVSFGGTTLRDSDVEAAMPAPSGAALSDPSIYEYAPIQYVDILF